jgi:hypothetical protein
MLRWQGKRQQKELVVECAENAASRGLNEVSNDHFSGSVGIDDKEDDSAMAVNEKEDLNDTTAEEKDDGRMAEGVAVAHRHSLEERMVPLHESTMKLL